MGISLFFQLFAGVPMDEMDVLPLIPLGRWLFTIGIYLLVISFRLGMNRQNRQSERNISDFCFVDSSRNSFIFIVPFYGNNEYKKNDTGCTAAYGRTNFFKCLSHKKNCTFYVWFMGYVCAE